MDKKGKAATRAKNKYRDANYDRIELAAPAGGKAKIDEAVKATGAESRNAYIISAIREKMMRDGVPLEPNDQI